MPDLVLCLLSLSPQVSNFCLSSPTELWDKLIPINSSLLGQDVCSQSFVYTEYENDLIKKKETHHFNFLIYFSSLKT